jgi:hypothetical protein
MEATIGEKENEKRKEKKRKTQNKAKQTKEDKQGNENVHNENARALIILLHHLGFNGGQNTSSARLWKRMVVIKAFV